MSNATPNPYLQAALDAADAAAQVIRAAYAQPFDVRYKQDASPVTEVDENAEKAIKQVLQTRFPEHGFFGCLLYTSPSPRDGLLSRMPSSA